MDLLNSALLLILGALIGYLLRPRIEQRIRTQQRAESEGDRQRREAQEVASGLLHLLDDLKKDFLNPVAQDAADKFQREFAQRLWLLRFARDAKVAATAQDVYDQFRATATLTTSATYFAEDRYLEQRVQVGEKRTGMLRGSRASLSEFIAAVKDWRL